MLLLWLALFKADTEEELKRISELGVTEMSEAVNAYHSATASAEFQEIERLRIKAGHDEAQALYNERRKERKKWQGVVAKKDAALSEKDAVLAAQAARIAELEAQIGST
jgi:vacuolar-type H+-ATPase subunit I/STV1